MQVSEGKLQVYVGCSLTKATEEFRQGVEHLKDEIRKKGYEVFDFVGIVNGTPRDVYEWDIGHCIKDCDVFVAICDEPSIGLGYELCEAVRLGKPVLAVAHQESIVTRLVTGAADVEPNLTFLRYRDFIKDVPTMVEKFVKKQRR
jgi:hypothetical protein